MKDYKENKNKIGEVKYRGMRFMIPSSWTNSDPIKSMSRIKTFNLVTSNLAAEKAHLLFIR